MLPPSGLRAGLERDARAFGALLREQDPATPVPSCPGWTLGDLAGHLGATHRWAADVLRSGQRAPQQEPTGDPRDWYDAGWPDLLAAIDATDPAAACWSFGPHPRQAGFWMRRQAHETALHGWDARTACGRDGGMDGRLAADGVDEVLTVFFPREVERGHCPEPSAAVALQYGGARRVVGDGDPVVTISGDPLSVLLLLWGRGGLDALETDGDGAAAAAFAALPMTP